MLFIGKSHICMPLIRIHGLNKSKNGAKYLQIESWLPEFTDITDTEAVFKPPIKYLTVFG